MNIIISDTTSLLSVQNAFSEAYPFLQIRFYNKPHKSRSRYTDADRIAETASVGDIKHTHAAGVVEVHPSTKVAEIEKEFWERFGLAVQILKKEKDDWQPVTEAVKESLKELNEMGKSY